MCAQTLGLTIFSCIFIPTSGLFVLEISLEIAIRTQINVLKSERITPYLAKYLSVLG